MLPSGEQQPFIQNEEFSFFVLPHHLLVGAGAVSDSEIIEKIRHPNTFNTEEIPAASEAECTGHVNFPRTRRSEDDNVEPVLNIGAGSKLADEGLVQFAVGMVFNVLYVGAREMKLCFPIKRVSLRDLLADHSAFTSIPSLSAKASVLIAGLRS